MILRLSSAFEALTDDELERNHDAFERMLNAHREGRHVFVPGQRVLRWLLAETSGFSLMQKAAAKEIRDASSMLGGLAKDARLVVLIVRTGDAPISERKNEKVVLEINSLRTGTLERAQILVENAAMDGAFLEILCTAFARETEYGRMLPMRITHGGGGTLGSEYHRAKEGDVPTLCVVDSDKASLEGRMGSTARGVISADRVLDNRLVRFVILDVREAENLIPLEIYRELFTNNPAIQATIDRIAQFAPHDRACSEKKEFIRWFDCKRGLKRQDFRNIELAASHDFMKQMWRVLVPSEMEFDSGGDQEDVICDGISNRALDALKAYCVQRRNRDRLRGAIKREIFSEYVLDLVRLIMAFSVGPESSRV